MYWLRLLLLRTDEESKNEKKDDTEVRVTEISQTSQEPPVVMFKSPSVFITALLAIAEPVVAISAIKSWYRKAVCHKLDLVSQVYYSEIIPGLYLSNARAAMDFDVLRYLDITHILSVEVRHVPKPALIGRNISTLHIRAYDNPNSNLLPFFPMAIDFIEEGLSRGNVLVHCHYGVSRSATIVIAYIMKKYNMNYEQGYHFVKAKRPFINPNHGFVQQLEEFYRNDYNVSCGNRFEAYVTIFGRKHFFKILSVAIVLGIVIPLAIIL